MKRLLGENQITGKYETVSTDGSGSLNTTGGGGAAFNGVIKANDGDDGSGTVRTVKCSSVGQLSMTNSDITSGNGVISAGGNLQQVLIYGKKPDNTLQPLECSGDRLLVDVVELAASGPITSSSALSSVQICGYNEDNTSIFRTLKAKADGTLRTEGISNLQGRTDIADPATTVFLKSSATGSLQVKVDDHASVVVQGVSDQANPFGTKKPLLIDTAGKLLTEDTQLTNNSISVAALTDSIKTLITDATVTRTSITFSGGTAISGGDFSNAVDVGTDRKSIHFFISGMANTHAGMIVLGSQDNSNFYNIQQFTPQTVGATVFCGGSLTTGYRYFKFENTGIAFTLSAAIINAYN